MPAIKALEARADGYADIPKTYKIRIGEDAFIATIATFLTIAFVSAAVRTGLRLWHYRKLSADDYLLIFACGCLGATAGLAWSIKDLIYLQIYVGLGWEIPQDDFYDQMLLFEQRIVLCSALVWAAIYAVKFSFLIFFKRLVHRVRPLEIQWWVVCAFLGAGALVSIPLAMIVCPHYGEDYMSYCSIPDQIAHEVVYLQTSVAIDVFTDVLLISIPVRLLWNLQMVLKKKLIVGSMLCLSLFMIIIAIVRTTLAPLPNGVIDTSWLVFWQGMEAVVAVLMVSLTAFRSLFSGEGSSRGSSGKRWWGSGKSGKASAGKGSAGKAATPQGSNQSSEQATSPKQRVFSMYNEDAVLLPDMPKRPDSSYSFGETVSGKPSFTAKLTERGPDGFQRL